MDSEVKRQLDDFCEQAGLTTSTAINMFAHAVLREHRLPFAVTVPSHTLEDIFERLGSWEDTRSAEEIIRDLYDSRISRPDVSL
jgi:addiction module RelB/DinJ family antitoxin